MKIGDKGRAINHLGTADYSPEKAALYHYGIKLALNGKTFHRDQFDGALCPKRSRFLRLALSLETMNGGINPTIIHRKHFVECCLFQVHCITAAISA
jgi:hypothetical protein